MSLWHALNYTISVLANVQMVSMASSFSSFLYDSLSLGVTLANKGFFDKILSRNTTEIESLMLTKVAISQKGRGRHQSWRQFYHQEV